MRICLSPTMRVALLVLVAVTAYLVSAATAGANPSPQNDRCFACHARADLGVTNVNGVQKSLTVDREVWNKSLHSLLDCTSCHLGFKAGAHSPQETAGWYAKASARACGYCHGVEYAMYSGSFHGKLEFKEGASSGAPTCADCHDPHDIIDPASATFRVQVTQRCEGCHGGKAARYRDTYHGKAFELGRMDAATCPDCHGGHKILPASDPASTVSAKHIVATCARCHPGANAAFASYIVHPSPGSPRSSLLLFSIRTFYMILIATVFTFGGVHSVLYFYRGRKLGLYRRTHH